LAFGAAPPDPFALPFALPVALACQRLGLRCGAPPDPLLEPFLEPFLVARASTATSVEDRCDRPCAAHAASVASTPPRSTAPLAEADAGPPPLPPPLPPLTRSCLGRFAAVKVCGSGWQLGTGPAARKLAMLDSLAATWRESRCAGAKNAVIRPSSGGLARGCFFM